jgi:hypothetical protein
MAVKFDEHRIIPGAIALLLLVGLAAGCGDGGNKRATADYGLHLKDLPLYPEAIEGLSLREESPDGRVGSRLTEYSTPDAFDDVVAFYSDSLGRYDPEIVIDKSDLGRQYGIFIPQTSGMVSAAIQEVVAQGTVTITLKYASP